MSESKTYTWNNVQGLLQSIDEVAEWLRRWTANPMGSARVGSNPILVVILKIVFVSWKHTCIFE